MLAAKRQWDESTNSVSKPFMTIARNVERRRYRRHDLEELHLAVERYDARRNTGEVVGTIVDLSAGGIRFKTRQTHIRPDTHIRLRLRLPAFAGISPFIDHENPQTPKTEWTGWMVVSRVQPRDDGAYDVAGRLVDMDEIDRGMLGLYLSTQPLAA
ncbi:MAG: hypothetical protein KatS3mg104_2738 [Phycisphaerae bacterium]|jgi:hypothetical protein|nr:MAG: hypothetical protein KatS3mg104_2738 [Phycisphaerae bacterium]